MPATPRETVEAERGPCPAVAHTSCVTWGWTVAPHLSRPPPYCPRPGHAPMPSAHAAWGGGRGWGSLVGPPLYRCSVPTCGSGTPQSHLKTPRTASSPLAASHPALPAAVEMSMAPGAGPGPAANQAGRTAPRGRVGGRRGQHTTHSVSRLEVPLRSGNSWMSVAPFRDLEAEPAARRQGQRVHVRLPALGVSLHVALPQPTSIALAPGTWGRPGLAAQGPGSLGARAQSASDTGGEQAGATAGRRRFGASEGPGRRGLSRHLLGWASSGIHPAPPS